MGRGAICVDGPAAAADFIAVFALDGFGEFAGRVAADGKVATARDRSAGRFYRYTGSRRPPGSARLPAPQSPDLVLQLFQLRFPASFGDSFSASPVQFRLAST